MGKIAYQVVLGGCLVAGVAHADSKLDEAKSHLQSGAALYDENNYRGALVEFQRAYELAPSYKIMFNIGQVEMELQDYAGALRAFTRYIKEGGPDVPSTRLAQVNAEIERLKGRVGFLVIQTTAGAQVLVDDAQVGYAPLPEPVAVAAGQHRVTVTIGRRDPVTRVFDVAGRQEVIAALALDPSVVPQNRPQPVTTTAWPVDTGPRSKIPMYAAWSAAGGLAVGAGVFALITHGNASDLAALRGKYPVTKAQLDAQSATTARNAAITDVLAGAALASAGVALYLMVTYKGDEERLSKSKAVQLQIAPTGVAIAGRF